jgi:hypothetical protein
MDKSIEHAIATYFSQWLGSHPYLAWIGSHPLPSLGLLFLTIFSLWGLIKAIGRGIEQMWLFLLKTPFKLFQPIFRLTWSLTRRIFGHTNSSDGNSESSSASSSSPAQIQQIVDRLQNLNQEQDLLLGELSTLLNANSVSAEIETISDTQYRNLYAKLPKFN